MNSRQRRKLEAEQHNQAIEDKKQLELYKAWLALNTKNQRLPKHIMLFADARRQGKSLAKSLLNAKSALTTNV